MPVKEQPRGWLNAGKVSPTAGYDLAGDYPAAVDGDGLPSLCGPVGKGGADMGAGKGSLSPLIERLLAMAFAQFTSAPVTAVTGVEGDDGGEVLFEPPTTWSVTREATREALGARASELLVQGPVLLVPPWERNPGVRRVGPRRRPELYAYEGVLRACTPAGSDHVMAVLTPADLWSSDAPWASGLRQDLAEFWDTHLVLYSQGGMSMGIHPGFRMAAAFLLPKGSSRPPGKIFQTVWGADEAVVEQDFERLLARKSGRGKYGYVLRELPHAGESLDFDRHDPAVLTQREELAGFGSLSTLGELCEILPRIDPAGDVGLICADEEPGAVRLLGGRDIGRDGTIAPPAEDTRWVHPPSGYLLRPGDLVVREVYGIGDPHGLVLGRVTELDLPAVASHLTVALRPHAGVEPQQIDLAVMFLRTPLARTLAGRSGLRVTARALRALPVPQPDEALAKAFDDLVAAREQLEGWQKEAEALMESVFAGKSAAQARSRIIDSGRSLRLRVEAASLLDELGHTVRTRFPYPIAYRWRETEALMSTDDRQAAHSAVLDTAEILLCYAAQHALALAHNAGVSLGAVTAVKEKLAGGRSGPGFGDWAAILNEVATSRKLRDLPAEHPLQELRRLLAGQATAQARQRLSERRNDQAHLRRVDTVDLPAAVQAAFADVTTLVEEARFLADWGLLHITEVRWDALSRTGHVAYRELMGDHPVVPTRSMTVPSNNLETGSLYLRDSNGAFHLLRPFLIGQDCPVCRAWSTFHVDRVPSSGVLLKSLEHGHVCQELSPAMPMALRHVGLL